MPEKNSLGILWGKNAFGFVVASGKQLITAAPMPFNTPLEGESSQDIPEDLKLTALIQKAVQQQNITTKQASLALSMKDVIFRSFIIPWMQPNEVKNVVDFEATKYIPIPLEQLTYTFHAVTLVDNNQKNLRILFFAARKDLLEKYTGIIERAGLQVEHVEPEPVSLVRFLQKHGHIAHNHSSAVIEIGQGEGKIILIEEDVVQFVREFPIPQEEFEDPSVFSAKLLNEIRVSLNFYTRQNPHGKIDRIITISLLEIPNLPNDLTKEFGKPVTVLGAAEVLKDYPLHDLSVLGAFGVALRDKSFSTKNFELGERAKKIQKADEATLVQIRRYLIMAGVIAGCIVVAFLAAFLLSQMTTGSKAKISQLENEIGMFRSLETADIEKKKTDLSAKLEGYKAIPLKSGLSFYLLHVPHLLPEGTWLKAMDLHASQAAKAEGRGSVSPVTVQLTGYAYLKDPNEQFRLVNSLVAGLKKNEDFAKSFDSITLEAINPESLNNYPVTSFRIVCK